MLLILGASPLVLVAGVWMHHTDTIGLSHGAERILTGLLAADIACLAAGLDLIATRRLLVLPDRIELSTSPLPRECSTTELRQHGPGQT